MTTETIIDRLRHYVAERRGMRGLDPDVVHAVHSPLDEPRHAELRLSDLSALLDALTAAHAELAIVRAERDQAREDRDTAKGKRNALSRENNQLRAKLRLHDLW